MSDMHAFGTKRTREGLRHRAQPRLGRSKGDKPRSAPHRGGGAGKKQSALLAGRQPQACLLTDQKSSIAGDAPDLFEVLRVNLENWSAVHVARVEDRHAERTDFVRFLKQLRHRARIRHIGRHHVDRATNIADIIGHRLELVFASGGNHRFKAALCKSLGQRLAQTRTGTRNDRHLSSRHFILPDIFSSFARRSFFSNTGCARAR